jgi:hypothetical protein
MKNSDVPVFDTTADQEESDVIFNFWKDNFVESLNLVEGCRCSLARKKIEVNVSLIFLSRVYTVVVVVFSENVHALLNVLKILACSKYFIEKCSRIPYYFLNVRVHLEKVSVSLR